MEMKVIKGSNVVKGRVKGKGHRISARIKMIVSNRRITQEELARRMGVTKQAVNWVLNNREDKDWTNKEIDYWCGLLKTESNVIYELRERALGE